MTDDQVALIAAAIMWVGKVRVRSQSVDDVNFMLDDAVRLSGWLVSRRPAVTGRWPRV